MKALITGAGGFCGQHLSRYLSGEGVDVHTLGVKEGPSPCHHYLHDITCVAKLAEILRTLRPNYIFHLAGLVHSADAILYYRVNTQYAVALLEAVEISGLVSCPILLTGTSAEYGMVSSGDLPITENLSANPYNHYGISKLAQTLAGLVAAKKGIPVVTVRPFNIIGPGMPKHLVIGSFVEQITAIMKGQNPPMLNVGNLNSRRDFIDINDIVKVYWDLIRTQTAYGQVVNVCSGKAVSIEEILVKLVNLSGLSVETIPDPSKIKRIDVPVHYGSTTKLKSLIGRTPALDLNDSLKRILHHSMNGPCQL